MADPSVLVLLATWNGERYLAEQIETVLCQRGARVRLLIRDDGSTDGTRAIAGDFARRFPQVDLAPEGPHLGSALGFMHLAWTAPLDGCDYVAFCDQDDFWLDGKLARAVSRIEAARGAGEPGIDRGALYYSDVINVDERLEGPVPSGAAAFADRARCVQPLLITNWAAGCTMVFDRRLAELLRRFRPNRLLRHHDSWVHLIALTCAGTVPDLAESGILRRVHGDNASDPTGGLAARIRRGVGMLTARDHFATRTAAQLLEGYGDLMAPDARTVVETFAAMVDSPEARLQVLADPGYRLPGRTRDLMARMALRFNVF